MEKTLQRKKVYLMIELCAFFFLKKKKAIEASKEEVHVKGLRNMNITKWTIPPN